MLARWLEGGTTSAPSNGVGFYDERPLSRRGPCGVGVGFAGWRVFGLATVGAFEMPVRARGEDGVLCSVGLAR
jgi:hypothetical protein